ncbi:MAG: PepSY-like domain-containing protein [Prevotella sp.]|nr:PepSY-like domain-containing protein [Prevotella sp.]
MKTIIAVIACLMAFMLKGHAATEKLPINSLPVNAMSFVQQNFPNRQIASIEKEMMGDSFEVSLNDGTLIDFDNNGNWDAIDCHSDAVPANVVPAAIMQIINDNFPGTLVVEIDKEDYGYEVELPCGVFLHFNHNNQLLGFD